MKKLSVILAIFFALTALSTIAFASDGLNELEGYYNALYVKYNRAMGVGEIWILRDGVDMISGVYRIRFEDFGIGDDTPYKIVSDGTPEGDAAAELFLASREIKPGTSIKVSLSDTVPEPYVFYDEEGRYNEVVKGVAEIVLGGVPEYYQEPENLAYAYELLNRCIVYDYDMLVQYETDIIDGELIVNRITVDPTNVEPGLITGLWVLFAEQQGDTASLVLGAYRDPSGEILAYYVEAAAGSFDMPKVGDLVYIRPNQIISSSGKLDGLLEIEVCETDEPPVDAKTVIDKLNEKLMSDGARAPMFTVTSDGAVMRQSTTPEPVTPPKTGAVYAALPIIAASAIIALCRKPR